MKQSGNDIAMYLSSPSSPPGPFRIGPYFQAERERKKQCSSKIGQKTTLHIIKRKKKTSWYHAIKIQILEGEKENKISFKLDLTAQSRHPELSQHPSIYNHRDGATAASYQPTSPLSSLDVFELWFLAAFSKAERCQKATSHPHLKSWQ